MKKFEIQQLHFTFQDKMVTKNLHIISEAIRNVQFHENLEELIINWNQTNSAVDFLKV